MSGAVLGAIEIQMLAGIARLRADMEEAKQVVGRAAQTMQSSVNFLKSAFAGVAGALTVGAFTSWVQAAIDAADETNKLAQRTGLAADEVAGLQLAFKLGGAGSEAFGSSMAKLSKQVVEGNAAFDTLGVKTRNADGSLRTSKEVLYDVADAFAGVQDGTAKSALAMEIFGKSGAELIPMLNAGADGLREMDEMARTLGLSISQDTAAQAEKFNDTLDLIKMSSQGIASQLAAELLPTLNSLAGGLLSALTEGDRLKKVAESLGVALKGVYSIVSIGLEVLTTFGKTLGALGGQLVALATGDFKAVRDIGQAWVEDIKGDWSKTVTNLGDVWTGAAGKTVEAGAAQAKTLRELQIKTKEQEEAAKAAAAESAKHAAEIAKLQKAGQDYVNTLDLQLAGLNQEISLGRQLTDVEKEQNKLSEQLRAGKLLLTEADEAAARAKIELMGQLREEQKARDELLKTQQAVAVHSAKLTDAQIAETEALRKGNVELRDQAEKLSLSEREIVSREAALLRATATDKEWQAANQGGNYQLEEQARLLKERADLLEQGVVVKEAKAAADEWQKTTDSINDGLTDALMRAFESGKGFMSAFRDTLVNAFKAMVLQPTIKAIMAPVSGALGSLFSGKAFAGQGVEGGMGSLLSSGMNFLSGASINSAASGGVIRLGDWLSTSSNNTLAGIGDFVSGNAGMLGSGLGMLGNGFAGYGISKALSGGYSAGSWVNTVAGIASAIPGIGPIAGVVGGLVNRAFGMKAKEMKDAGISGTITGGDVTGNTFQDWFQKGGWFRSNKSGTDLTDMNADVAAALDLGAGGVLRQVQAYAAVLQLPGEALRSVTSTFRVKLTGEAQADQAAIASVLKDYEDTLSARFASALAPLMKAGESASEALARLAGLQQFSESINAFGGVFSRIAGSSIAARENLIQLAGGIDALMAKAGRFVQDYYSTSEQAGLQARSISEALAAVGLSGGSLSSREDFRALVESLDISTETGRAQLNALLDIAPQFAQLGDYLRDQQLTLQEALDAAPQVAALEALRGEQLDQTASIDNVGVQIEAGNTILAQIASGIAALQASIEAGLATVASNTASTTRLLDSWDDGGAIVTTAP